MKSLEFELDKESLRLLLNYKLRKYEVDEEKEEELNKLLEYSKGKFKRLEYIYWKKLYQDVKDGVKNDKEKRKNKV